MGLALASLSWGLVLSLISSMPGKLRVSLASFTGQVTSGHSVAGCGGAKSFV